LGTQFKDAGLLSNVGNRTDRRFWPYAYLSHGYLSGDGRCKNTAPTFLGPDGHVQRRIDLVADENTAKEQAKQLVDGHDVELWQLDRKIVVLDHQTKSVKSG
jgi:hypothetical protein